MIYFFQIASTSLPTNTNAPIWSMSIEIHGKFLLGRLLLLCTSVQAFKRLHISAARHPSTRGQFLDMFRKR